MKDSVKRTEKGWGGHFICCHYCAFRRHTMLEYGEITISVSSVGNMLKNERERKIETIGSERYFETMAFHSEPPRDGNPWKDADVSRQINFNSPWSIDQPWMEQQANEMHEAVVAEITQGLLAGNKYEPTVY